MARTDPRWRIAIAASLMGALAAPLPAFAQVVTDNIHVGSLDIPLNKSEVVRADRPIDRAMIGNAEIADVLPLTDRSIYVLGRSIGTTSLTLYDTGGRVLAVMDIAVGPDAGALQTQIGRLLPNSKIEASISGTSIVLTGIAADAAEVDRAVRLAQTYGGEDIVNLVGIGSSQQVMLEVKFAEVRREIGEDVGVGNFISSPDGSFNAAIGAGATLRANPDGPGTLFGLANVTNAFGVFGKTFSAIGLDFESYLNVLENKGYAKTLAEPTLVALSGETASFLAGGEFPVPVAQSNSGNGNGNNGGISVQFKPFGVSLAFTPTVLSDRTINLKVEPEVSSIDPASSVQVNGLSIPGLQTRRASTTLELRDGESFAIAGLIQEDFSTTINQVPLLGSIPILGALFRSTEFQKGETELLIVVTPRLVAPIKPSQVKLPTDAIKDPDPATSILMGEPFIRSDSNSGTQTTPAESDDYEY